MDLSESFNAFKIDGFDFNEVVKRGAIIIDVRTQAEFVDGNINGSVNIPLSELLLSLDVFDVDIPIVVYCASGIRSTFAKKILQENGIKEVYNAGGIVDLYRMTK